MKKYDEAILVAVDCLGLPYIWGGNTPVDGGVDCSGLIGYVLRTIGMLPPGYDDTAQGYYNRYKANAITRPLRGSLAFYGKKGTRITHVMLIVNERACIGAVRGNRWTDTIEKAKRKKAMITHRPIKYRKDLILMADPFKSERRS